MFSACTLLLITAALAAPPLAELPEAPVTEAAAMLDGEPLFGPFPADALVVEAAPVVAAVETAEPDALTQRLLSGPEERAGAPAAPQPSLPAFPPWLWVVGMAGVGGVYFLRKRQRSGAAHAATVEVVSRTGLGGKSGLAVIRVQGEDGRTRRLLLSTGEGPASLVAHLGSGVDELAPDTREPSEEHDFQAELDDSLEQEWTALDEQSSLLEAEAPEPPEQPPQEQDTVAVPPQKVSVWNETPDEFRREERQVVAEEPCCEAPEPACEPVESIAAPEPSPAPQVPLAEQTAPDPFTELEALLGDEDAPEMVMDVCWDDESGWKLPGAASRDELPVERVEEAGATASHPDERPGAVEGSSFTALIDASVAGPAPQVVGGGAASSKARGRVIRPEIRVVRPLRPWEDPPKRKRTAYGHTAVASPALFTDDELARGPRDAAEVHDLVAEVLRERTEPVQDADQSEPGRRNGVVELARYLGRKVAR